MSARWDGHAFHWDEKILPVRYDSSPKNRAHPGAPSPLPMSQEPGRVLQHLAGCLMSLYDAPVGAVCGGKAGYWPWLRSGAGVLCREAALPARHTQRARAQPRQERPILGRSGPSHPRSDRPWAGPFSATTGPCRFRSGPSSVRQDHPPSPPRSQPGRGSPAPER